MLKSIATCYYEVDMNFNQEVYKLVRTIPSGRVMTYGQIAGYISTPRAARMVGMALRSLPEKSNVPWQRVINSKGFITIENMDHPAEEQANLLMAEGIEVARDSNRYNINLQNYLWQPSELTKA